MPAPKRLSGQYAQEEYAIYLGLHRLLNNEAGITNADPLSFSCFENIHEIGTHTMLQEMVRCLCICRRVEPVPVIRKEFNYQ